MSSTTLEDLLCENETVLNFDTVCAIACDVISAIEQLQDLGILHNNITARNILVGQCPRVSKPYTAARVVVCFFCNFFRQYTFLIDPGNM